MSGPYHEFDIGKRLSVFLTLAMLLGFIAYVLTLVFG